MSNIFVGNLSFQTTHDDLLAVFSRFGRVERVKMVVDRDTGQHRGFAFVEMSNAQDAKTAITKLNGFELNGRPLTVNAARPRPSVSMGRGEYEAGSRKDYSRRGSRL